MANNRGSLADSERLPLPAAADMLALALMTEAHVRHPVQNELDSFLKRAYASSDEAGSARFSIVVLSALSQIGPAGGLTLLAAQSAADLMTLVCLRSAESVATAASLVCTGSDQFSSATAHSLIASLTSDERFAAASCAVTDWLAAGTHTWGENDAATGRDMLIGHIAVAMARAERFSESVSIAEVWPPTRSFLSDLCRCLAKAGAAQSVLRIAERLDPDGLLHRAVVAALVECDRGALDSEQRETLAEALWSLAPELQHASQFAEDLAPAAWQQRRESLAADALVHGDTDEVIGALGDGPEAVSALLGMIERNPGRGRFVKGAISKLDAVDRDAALQARCVWLNKVCQSWPSLASASRARRAVAELRAAAKRVGEPALAEHFLEALRTGCNEPALLAVLR